MKDKVFTKDHAAELVAETTVVIPEGYTQIGYSAFDYSPVVRVVCPEGLEVIGDSAFMFCFELEDVSIPKSVREIGDGAFMHCEKLKTLTLSGNVQSIGVGAFSGCTLLTVRCTKNSFVHRYCKKNNIRFELV